jgi:hypothetical protein
MTQDPAECRDLVFSAFNPLNAELNPICHLLALLGAHHILHVSRIRVKFKHFIPIKCHPLSTDS